MRRYLRRRNRGNQLLRCQRTPINHPYSASNTPPVKCFSAGHLHSQTEGSIWGDSQKHVSFEKPASGR